jgi:aspartate aminotransferase/aromatic-amino-acid transaminase
MSFTRKSADLTPIVDTVFSIVAKAKEDKQKNGPDQVVDATIGSLYGEDSRLVAYDTVFDHYDAIAHRDKAAYAASFTGNPDYRREVYNWVTYGTDLHLAHSVIATPGGSGAVSLGFTTFLDEGETAILPEIAWGSYKLMVHENNMNAVYYDNFDGDHFNFASLRKAIDAVKAKQDRVVIVLNDPCQNPTGYSLSDDEWKQLVDYLNEVSRTNSVILMNDIAYFDYAYRSMKETRAYMNLFNQLSENVMVEICFSCSKTLTSYGLRCGAAVLLAQRQEDVRNVEIIMEKKARATWSNIPNAAMKNFVWAVTDGRELFLKEKQKYVDLIRERSSLFLQEADACGLPYYPYKEGFFVTLRIPDNKVRDTYHNALMANHIYTVEVNHGIRVAVCSLPVDKVKGLAPRMKEILDSIQ